MDVGDRRHRLTTGIRLGEGGERPQVSQRRTSAAEAVKGANVYGTAEAVPFVQSFSSPGECTSGAKALSGGRIYGPTKSRALIRSLRAVTVQTSVFRQVRSINLLRKGNRAPSSDLWSDGTGDLLGGMRDSLTGANGERYGFGGDIE